jgi:hypothetical protein
LKSFLPKRKVTPLTQISRMQPNIIQWDPLGSTSFPFLNELFTLIRAKYNLPFTIPAWSQSSTPLPHGLYAEYQEAIEKAKKWLRENYSDECKTLYSSRKFCSGEGLCKLELFISNEASPEPHGGYPGSQWAWDTSEAGRMALTTQAINRAFYHVSSTRERTISAQKAVEAGRVLAEKAAADKAAALKVAKEKARAEKEAKLKAIEDKLRDAWIPRLCSSLSMHYCAPGIRNGVNRPAEYFPDFNLELIDQMDYDCRRNLGQYALPIAKRLLDDAYILSNEKAREMLRQHKEKQQKEELEREVLRARLLAEAMLEAQQAKQIPDANVLKGKSGIKKPATPPIAHLSLPPLAAQEKEIYDPVALVEQYEPYDPVAILEENQVIPQPIIQKHQRHLNPTQISAAAGGGGGERCAS